MAHLTKGGVAKIASSVLRLCLEKPVLENYGMAVYISLDLSGIRQPVAMPHTVSSARVINSCIKKDNTSLI